jgi:hypothetical protein
MSAASISVWTFLNSELTGTTINSKIKSQNSKA